MPYFGHVNEAGLERPHQQYRDIAFLGQRRFRLPEAAKQSEHIHGQGEYLQTHPAANSAKRAE